MKKDSNVLTCTGGGGPVLSGSSVALGLRLALSCSTRGKRACVLTALRTPLAHANATARVSGQERGLDRRTLVSSQGKPCSVALLGLAFTMAEILLSLTIIGVVAAITLPSLTGNINERTWNTQRKALYARFSQAIALMPALNAYGTLTEDENGSITEDTAAETFITEGLSKVLKINNICDADHLTDCGIVSKITTMYGSVTSLPLKLDGLGGYGGHVMSGIRPTKAAAFETQNGESIAVYYNPICLGNWKIDGRLNSYVGNDLCANFIFDLNGNKGPNTVGKDIGIMTVFYSSDSSVVMPVPFVRSPQGLPFDESKKVCKTLGDNLRQATLDEVGSIFINQPVVGGQVFNDYADGVWGSDGIVEKGKNPYHINRWWGLRYNSYPAASHYGTMCIQR